MKAKCLQIFFWIFLVLGVLSIFLGVLIPLFVGNLIDDGLRDLWLKPGEHEKWGETPGKNEIKVVRSYALFNITNVPDILAGGRGNLTELPASTFQEYSQMFNWSYMDEELKDLGQDKAGDYVAFNYYTNLSSIPSNLSAVVPGNALVTGVNYLTYFTFYSLTHSPPPLYMIPTMFEVVNAIEIDFYKMIISYVCWKKYLNDTEFTSGYLASQGFNESQINEIISDVEYGWGTWQTFKPWIESLLDYQNGNSDTFFSIQARFQIDGLIELISEGSFLNELVEAIQADMLTRYGTNDPVQLGILHWSTGIVTLSLPLGLGTLNIPGSKSPLPSFIMMNQTFSTFPEIYFLQLALQIQTPLFAINASELLEVYYEYPRQNNGSFLNLRNLGALFTDPNATVEYFGFTDTQRGVAQKYLGSLVNFPVPAYNVGVDGYTLHLTKVAGNSFVANTVSLRNDAFWSIPTILVFQYFAEEGVNCVDWVSQVSPSLASVCSSTLGWNTTTKNWSAMQLWIKAAYKNSSSSEYQTLAAVIPEAQLIELLYSNLPNLNLTTYEALQNTSAHYGCSKRVCNMEELFYMQWSSAAVTMNPPAEAQAYVPPAPSIYVWIQQPRYLLPIEWSFYSALPALPLAPKALSYSYFLNPGVIRAFFNSYFQGDLAATALTFQLPNTAYVEALYQYLLKIVPGLTFFTTRTYNSWMFGYLDVYSYYIANMNVYQGGMPIVGYLGAAAANATDAGRPRSIVNSGRSDTKQTKFYYYYIGSEIQKQYTLTYDEYSPTKRSPTYKTIWGEDIPYNGGDGGQFGTQINDNDDVTVFITSINRNFNLTYDSDTTFHGLGLSRFYPTKTSLNTSATAPENAKFNMFENGYDGFVNLSSVLGSPAFAGFKRCYRCSQAALNMFDLYEYLDVGKVGGLITPKKPDMPFAEIEPLTGTGVRVYLTLEMRVAFYNDYFFKGLYEPTPGKGVYFPFYLLERKAELSKHQVDKYFGNLQQIKEVRKIIFLIGVIVGSGFIAAALACGVFMYRRNKFKTWSSPRNTLIRRYVTKKDNELNI